VAFMLKTPLGTIALLALSLFGWRLGARLSRREVVVLLGPAALFLVAMMLTRVNLGLRIILPVYPFVFILAARVATFAAPGWWRIVVSLGIVLAIAATAWSSLRSAPWQLSYFNELIGGREQAQRYLGDSNLDWGQDLFALKEFVDKQGAPIIYLSYAGTAPPHKYGLRYQHLPGWGHERLVPPPGDAVPADAPRHLLAISVTNLQGIYLPNKQLYHWLRDRQPIATLGHGIWVFDLTADTDALRRIRALIE